MIAKTILIPILTIWIHGTTRVTRYIPGASEFLGTAAGLHQASELDPCSIHGQVAQTLCAASPDLYNSDNFYFYGWSGHLDVQERERVGIRAARSIAQLVHTYEEKHGKKPLVRVITHSHGGNVALNMTKAELPNLVIDELILLACPVQKQTMHHAQHPMFKQIYSIHSHWDMLQVLDPQGLPEFQAAFKQLFDTKSIDQAKEIIKSFETKQLFSERHFPHQENLTQIRVTKQLRELLHVEFFLQGFIKNLASIMQKADEMKAAKIDEEYTIEIE